MPDGNKTISVPMYSYEDFKKNIIPPLLPINQIDRNITSDEIQELKDKVTNLENTIKHIFGNHVLVNGQWVEVK